MIIKLLVVAIVVALLLAMMFPKLLPKWLGGLGRSTGTAGRLGRELVTGQEEPGSPLARYEVRAGELVLAKTLATHPPCADAALDRQVAAIGERLAFHAMRREIPYRFRVVEADAPNAFAIPGGNVLVTRPLVELCGDDTDALAGIIGHEILHVDRRHALHQSAARLAARTGSRLLRLGGPILGHVTSTFQDLLVSGYRQDQEFEADLEGARLARKAGYDPAGLGRALAVFLAQAPNSDSPLWEILQYLQSHPPLPERIERLRNHFG